MFFSRAISAIFHPWLIPLYSVAFIFHSGSWISTLNNDAKGFVYLVTLTTFIILPLISLYLLRSLGWISSLQMIDPKEKRLAVMMNALYALVASFVMLKASAPLILSIYFNGLSIVLLACALITSRWNISLHMVMLGALAGLVLALSFKWMLDLRIWLSAVLLVGSIVAFVRLYTNQHRPAQVYSGFLLGTGSLFLLVYLI